MKFGIGPDAHVWGKFKRRFWGDYVRRLQGKYKDADKSYGSELLNLVVAKGYVTKLVGNEAVRSWLARKAPEILEQFKLVISTTSMEEALDQKAQEEGQSATMGHSEDDEARSERDFAAEQRRSLEALETAGCGRLSPDGNGLRRGLKRTEIAGAEI